MVHLALSAERLVGGMVSRISLMLSITNFLFLYNCIDMTIEEYWHLVEENEGKLFFAVPVYEEIDQKCEPKWYAFLQPY